MGDFEDYRIFNKFNDSVLRGISTQTTSIKVDNIK